MNIKSILTTAFLLASFMTAGAQTRYLNVKIADGQYKSFEVTPNLKVTWDLENYEEKNKPATTTGTAKAMIDNVETDVNWVQLWEGGPKFADRNIGATSETDYGGYYAWGGSQNKVDDHNKANTGSGNLTGTDDTATKLWGSNWRMPIQTELEALINSTNCDMKWFDGNNEKYNNSNVAGYLFTGKADPYKSNSVFLPAAGGGGHGYDYTHGYDGHYWSSTPAGEYYAYYLNFNSGDQHVFSNERDYGISVRAVLAE